MKIKLMQSGGFLPVTKEADANVNWTEEECDNILRHIAIPVNQYHSATRDGISYTLDVNNRQIAIDPAKAQGEYADVFTWLKNNLKIVKT